ncbi:MAG: NADH-quinone oxidoreductase subunit N, partial [Flavisolibacter sp.]|nr:NADH-quinone oxidoreductase subunit N [Flavisolibacter sp.]
MLTNFLILMKQELIVTVLIFILLIIKIGKDRTNESMINLVNGLLLINLIAGFIYNQQGSLFSDMFRTTPLAVLEKNILSLGTLIISLQSYSWLRTHKHV